MKSDNRVCKQKTILLDRDGVINRDLPGSVRSLNDFHLLPGSLKAIKKLKQAGFIVLVLTNQACIGRGDLSMHTLESMHQTLQHDVELSGSGIDDFFICPHVPEDLCLCRKPLPGLIDQARDKWKFTASATCFVGDDVRDIEAAQAGGCKPVLVLSGKGRKTHEKLPNIPVYEDLLSFVETICSPK